MTDATLLSVWLRKIKEAPIILANMEWCGCAVVLCDNAAEPWTHRRAGQGGDARAVVERRRDLHHVAADLSQSKNNIKYHFPKVSI
jgi:hypothetical protein